MRQIPLDALTVEEEERLEKAYLVMRQQIMELRETGRPAGLMVRANLAPCGTGTPALLRGFKYEVAWED